MALDKLCNPPAPNEIEVSVFGPGFGECILLHVGDSKWFIVDSCINPSSQNPVALEYLERLHVAPSTNVKQVIATHWHDDHIGGLGKVFEACHNADFVCSGAILSKEFFEVAEAYGYRLMTETSTGVSEFSEILRNLEERKKQLGVRYLPPIFAVANRSICTDYIQSMNSQFSLYTLSPSDANILAAKMDFLRLLPNVRQPKRRVLYTTPNRSAVVLWASIGDLHILLGNDMEESNDAQTGWSVIVGSTSRPSAKASVFKVPHHGSINGHHPEVWRKMLINNPFSILTPFSRGNNSLPTDNDAERICNLTENAYSTSKAPRRKMVKRDRTVEKMIKETAKSIKQIHTDFGHVRLRAKQNTPWAIELFGNAIPLREFVAA